MVLTMNKKIIIAISLVLILVVGGIFLYKEKINQRDLERNELESIAKYSTRFNNTYFNSTSERENMHTLIGDSGVSIIKGAYEFYIEMPIAINFSTDINKTLTVNYPDYDGVYYMKDPDNFEWEMHVDRSPPQNCYYFPIEINNLTFFHQPPLDEEENDIGITCNATSCLNEQGENVMERPINVVNSYAIYSPEGKFGHLYRPFVNHSKGFDWLTWEITNTSLGICGFDAIGNVRDLIIGPTFGYTSEGASNGGLSTSEARGNSHSADFYTAEEGDKLVGFASYAKTYSNPATINVSLYNVTAGLPDAKVGASATFTAISSGVRWLYSTDVDIDLVAGQTYTIGLGDMSVNQYRQYHDTLADAVSRQTSSGSLEAVWDHNLYSAVRYSLFGIYKKGSACEGGICEFDSQYSEVDIRLKEELEFAITSDYANLFKFNISDLCTLDFSSIDSAHIQLYVSGVGGTPDNDDRIWYYRDQTISSSTTAAALDAMTKYNTTYDANGWPDATTGFKNVSITKFVQEACNRNEFLTFALHDNDYQVTTIRTVASGSTLINGHDDFISPVRRSIAQESDLDYAQRPLIYVEYTQRDFPEINLTGPEDGFQINYSENMDTYFSANYSDATQNISNISLWANWDDGWHEVETYEIGNQSSGVHNVSFNPYIDYRRNTDGQFSFVNSHTLDPQATGLTWNDTLGGEEFVDVADTTGEFYMEFNNTNSSEDQVRDIASLTTLGATESRGVTQWQDGTVWILDTTDKWLYHIYHTNGSEVDAGLNLSHMPRPNPIGWRDVCSNGTDFWFGDAGSDYVYHINATGARVEDNTEINLSFWNITGSPAGLSCNGVDFFVQEFQDATVRHFVNNTLLDSWVIQHNATTLSPATLTAGVNWETQFNGNKYPEVIWIADCTIDDVTPYRPPVAGSYIWGMRVCDTNGDCTWSSENRTINLGGDSVTMSVPAFQSPVVVSNATNLSVTFNVIEGGSEVTTGVNLFNASFPIDDALCTLNDDLTYTGTEWNFSCVVPNKTSTDYDFKIVVNTSTIGFLSDTNVLSVRYVAPPGEDTCTYPGSGDWFIECSDNCILETQTEIDGSALIFNGTGTATINAQLYNMNYLIKDRQCQVRKLNTVKMFW